MPTLSPFPTLPLARSLGGNDIGKEGVTALAAILKETKITELKCAAAPTAAPEVFAFVQRPLTYLLSHRSILPPRSQYLWQRDRRRGRHCTRRHPQGNEDHCAQVRRRPSVRLFVSAPVDTPTLSPFPILPLAPSLAVSQSTVSETWASLRSLPPSRRQRSLTSSAPPP